MLRPEIARIFSKTIGGFHEYVNAREGERPPNWGKEGVYWCSHCAKWISAEKGAADTLERVIGPVCDSCACTKRSIKRFFKKFTKNLCSGDIHE